MYEVPRIIIQVASAVIYFILVKYMIKPYSLTGEQRYLGLPLGFAFLGISEVILGIQIFLPLGPVSGLSVTTRTFAFVFLALTYYFAKPLRKGQLVWTAILSLLVVGTAISSMVLVGAPLLDIEAPASLSVLLRLVSLIFIGYVCVSTLKSHIKHPEPTTIWIPLGFIMLGISQYSQVIRFIDAGAAYGGAFIGGIVTRFIGLAIFLFVAYRTFYGSNTREDLDEKDRTQR